MSAPRRDFCLADFSIDAAAALASAGVRVTRSGGWLRIPARWREGRGQNVSVHPRSGGWTDHVTGEHGGWRSLCDRLGIPSGLPPIGGAPPKHFSSPAEIAARAARREDREKQDQDERSRRVAQARRAWAAGIGLDTDHPDARAMRDYLDSRGAGIRAAAQSAGVRVLPAEHGAARGRPCVLWPMRDPRTGDLVGIQREWGRGGGNKKMMGLHMTPIDPAQPDLRQCASFVYPAARGAGEIYISEGQISAAAVAAATGCATIPGYDTSGIASPPRPTIERLVAAGAKKIIVAGDSGAAGEAAALRGIRQIQTWGLGVEIIWTVPPGDEDWADILKRGDAQTVRDALTSGVRAIPPERAEPNQETVWAMQPWRSIDAAATSLHEVTVDQARAQLSAGMHNMVREYLAHLAALDARREKNQHGKLPGVRPWLFRPTTGAGKTTEIKNLISNAELLAAGGTCLALAPDHEQAETYERAGWWHYHGRTPDQCSPGYCPNFSEMLKAVTQGHIPQSTFCHRCPNGLRWVMNRADEDGDAAGRIDAENKLRRMGFAGAQIAAIEPCRWQQHLRDTMLQQFVVAVSQSYSDTLAIWARDGLRKQSDAAQACAGVQRLVLVDEHAVLSQMIEIGMPDLDLWTQRARALLAEMGEPAEVEAQSEVDDPFSGLAQIEDERSEHECRADALRAALQIFAGLGAELAKWLGKAGRISVSPGTAAALADIVEQAGKNETAEWETLEFGRDSTLRTAPLRAAYAGAQTLKYGDGRVRNGKIHIAATKPLLDRIGSKPVAFFDATPDAVTVAAVEAAEGHIVDAVAQQHVRIIRYPARFWGLTALGANGGAGRKERERSKYRTLRALHAGAAMLVHKQAHDALDPEDDAGDRQDPNLGHWGADHRAHDRWAQQDLVIVGSFAPPGDSWQAMYQADRIAALAAGAPAQNWPAASDVMEVEHGAWIAEGDVEVQSRLPLPIDPQIRSWLLRKITSETVQAIGRVRGANADPDAPITIHIYGGVPLHGVGNHGLAVDEYRLDPPELGPSRATRGIDAQRQIAAAYHGGERTVQSIKSWIQSTAGRSVGDETIRRVRRDLESAARMSGQTIERIAQIAMQAADAILHAAGDLQVAVALAARRPAWLPAALLLDAALTAQSSTQTRTGPPPQQAVSA